MFKSNGLTSVLCLDVDETWEQFINLFLKAVDKVAPIKTIRGFRTTKEQDDLDNYKNLRHMEQKMIKMCKRYFFVRQLLNIKVTQRNFCSH